MTDGPQDAVCAKHGYVMIPAGPGRAACAEGCTVDINGAFPFPQSPLTGLEIGACQRHEIVLAHEKAGFSRTEAMQIMCCMIQASIMKGSG